MVDSAYYTTGLGHKDAGGFPLATSSHGFVNMYDRAGARRDYLKPIHYNVNIVRYRKDGLGFYLEAPLVDNNNRPIAGGHVMKEYNYINKNGHWIMSVVGTNNPNDPLTYINGGWPESVYRN